MNKILIGNSVTLCKKIFDVGNSEINLSELMEIKVYLIYYATKRNLTNFIISDQNELVITLSPEFIRQTGKYYLVISITDENNNTYTTPLIEAVEVSKTEGVVISTDNNNINIGGGVDLSNYYTKSEIDKLLLDISVGDGEVNIDLSNYYTKSKIDTLLLNKANSTHTHSVYANKSDVYTRSEIDTKFENISVGDGEVNIDLSKYTLKAEQNLINADLESKIQDTNTTINTKADKTLVDTINSNVQRNATNITSLGYSKLDKTEHEALSDIVDTHTDDLAEMDERFTSNYTNLDRKVSDHIGSDFALLNEDFLLFERETNESISNITQDISTNIEDIANVIGDIEVIKTSKADKTEINTLKNYVDTEISNISLTSNNEFTETNEDGFYICDKDGNVLAQFTSNGFDVAKIGDNLQTIINNSISNDTIISEVKDISISGSKFLSLNSNNEVIGTFTAITTPNLVENNNVVWSCDNGQIISSSNTVCNVIFNKIGYAVIRCVLISDSRIFKEYRVNIINDNSIENVNIQYYYSNTDLCSVGGNLEITTNISRTYSIYWGNENGILGEYDILNYKVDLALTKDIPYFVSINDNTCIPKNATRLYIEGDKIHYIDIPKNKQFTETKLGTLINTIGVMSDIHTTASDSYLEISNDLPTALNLFESLDVDFISTCGDITDNATDEQWQIFNNAIKDYNKDIYLIAGNHDNQQGNGDSVIWNNKAKQPYNYIIKYGDKANNQVESDFSTAVLYRDDIGINDVYVYLSVSSTNYNIRTIAVKYRTWLEDILTQNKNKRIFLFTHIPYTGMSGNVNLGYTFPNEESEYYIWLKPLLESNKNVIMFHGHSHWMSSYAIKDKTLPTYKNGFNAIHIPSLACPRTTSGKTASQGQISIIEIYEKGIVSKVYDLISGKYQALGEIIIIK